ncbi:MAG: helix-turn-helix domain-containing protein [Elainellaceae cyanobacterium]
MAMPWGWTTYAVFVDGAMTDAELITVSEASELSGYTPQHVRLLIRQGLINARRAGGIWLVEASSLREYIESAPKPGPKADQPEK